MIMLLIVLFSINGIQSNKTINGQQIISFCESIAVSEDEMKQVNEWISSMNFSDNEYVVVKKFSALVENHESILKNIDKCKMILIDKVIGFNCYNVIMERIGFYRFTSDCNTQIDLPSETCVERFERHCVSHLPPAYYYDYMSVNFTEGRDLYFYNLRKRFGYSIRINSSCCNSKQQFLLTDSAHLVSVKSSGSMSSNSSPHMHIHRYCPNQIYPTEDFVPSNVNK